MARMRWTDEKIAELRRRMNLEQTYAEIGQAFGTTEAAIRSKVHRLGWGSYGRGGFSAYRRLKGVSRPAHAVANLAEHSRRRWRDPVQRERMLARLASPEMQAKRSAARRAAWDAIRGFAVPAEKAGEYRWLTQSKRLPAVEAGRILGLIPQPVIGEQHG